MKYYFWLLLALLFVGCNTPKTTTGPTDIIQEPEVVVIEERDLDTLVVSAPDANLAPDPSSFSLPVYNPSPRRSNDLIHTKLDLKFDWEIEQVIGKAYLTLKPFFYPTDRLVLDAKGFTFNKVAFEESGDELKYTYNDEQIEIDLGRPFLPDEEYKIFIDYVAAPAETGGSAAITSDQGLFFVNPRGEEGDKPQQIWTQGETEWNSRWFPTIDKPNERCTQEMLLTVDKKFKTLSNGLLVNSTENADGTRTDYWKMDLPHAPYLFMIAIGEFAVVKEEWRGITVDYYVEPEYESSAKGIFSNTVEMLEFFSNILDFPYPWSKYSQIIVRDYVSGAMENTTGVIFGEFVQKTNRELIDNHNERIVAHELFHHWFGDYVTCESWANLTMNEGFANYSEYLWFEYKYGSDEADYHFLNERNGYIGSARNQIHPLIHYGYFDKEEMFDAHSYNKGGAVLHMLRDYVGDDAFFAALNLYLKENAYTSVEVHDLRLAFEKVTGEDLNWFFNQWFLEQGHPQLEVIYAYDEAQKTCEVTVEQLQDPEVMPAIFRLPTAIDIYTGEGKPIRKEVVVDKRKQTFIFDLPEEPKLVTFDADRVLLAEKTNNKTEEQLIFQFLNAPKFMDRFEAMEGLSGSTSLEAKLLYKQALNDPFWVIRSMGISIYDAEGDAEAVSTIRALAANDPRSEVRSLAFEKLKVLGDTDAVDMAKKAIETDSVYAVVGAALNFLVDIDKAVAMEYARKLENEKNTEILDAIASMYADDPDPERLDFFEKNFSEVDGFGAISFMAKYQLIAAEAELDQSLEAMENMKALALDGRESLWRKFGATRAINEMILEYQTRAETESDAAKAGQYNSFVGTLQNMITEIKEKETNQQLKSLYDQM